MTAEMWYYEMLGILMDQFEAKGAIYIDNAFRIEGRGIVLAGGLRGKIKCWDRILINPDGNESIETKVLGLERFRKLEAILESGPELMGCGVLIPEMNVDVQWFKEKFLVVR